MRSKLTRLVVAAAVTLLMLHFTTSPRVAHAMTYTVINTNNGGLGSLRDALTQTNGGAGGDTITFAIPGGGPYIIGILSELLITQPVSIDGSTQPGVIIDAGGNSRIFNVQSAGNTQLQYLTIRNGVATSGGGIYAALPGNATLIIDHSTITNNQANFGGRNGGGIYNEVVPGQTGGTIVRYSTVSGNQAGFGGGIYNNGLRVDVDHSTISNNQGAFGGGGFYIPTINNATVNVINSTVDNNVSASGAGGGFYVEQPAGRLNITASTITSNSASGGGSGIYMDSGGTTLKNTILALNVPDDAFGTLTSLDYNLIQTPPGGFTAQPNDITGLDPLLDPLALNAPGTTQTRALQPASPALDKIPNTNGCNNSNTLTDQRGVSRPQPLGGLCDIGAYEGATVPTPTPTLTETLTETPTPTQTPSFTATLTPSSTDTVTPSATLTLTLPPTLTATLTPSMTATDTPLPTLTNTPIPTVTLTDTPLPTLTATLTASPLPTLTATPLPTLTLTNTLVPTVTLTDTLLPTLTATLTASPLPTLTATPLPTLTFTNTPLPTLTATLTDTPIPTVAPTNTLLPTLTLTNTPIPTDTSVPTLKPTATLIASTTLIPSVTPTGTNVPTLTPSVTASLSASVTITAAPTQTAAVTGTTSLTPSLTLSPTLTSTAGLTLTPLATLTATGTASTSVPASATLPSPTPFIGKADPVILKSSSLQLARPGESVTFTITVYNQGTLAAVGVIVNDPLPAELQVISASTTQGTFTVSGQTVTFNIGVVNPGQTVTLTVVARVRANVQPPVNVSNTGVLDYGAGERRTSTASLRITGGILPATGEHPAEPWTPNQLSLITVVIGTAVILIALYRRRRRNSLKS